MKLIRFTIEGDFYPLYGLIKNDEIIPLKKGPFTEIILDDGKSFPLNKARVLPPSIPTKIVAVGLNYRDHANELGMELSEVPLLFLKPPSSIIGHKGKIKLPASSSRVDYEGELCIVMGKKAKDVPARDASQYILGYTCLNDVTARDIQRKDIQFTRSKSFDTFCPVGPWIETEIDPSNLDVQCILNGEVRQSSNTCQLIHTVPELVSFISHVMTLEPGDIISTGTPAGIGQIKPGDEVRVVIEGIGELINYVG